MTDKELMQQTLYTLEHFYENGYDREDCFAAITNLLQRLAQPEQEPVAWHHPECKGECIACLIQRAVQDEYGTQGLDYLLRHVTTVGTPQPEQSRAEKMRDAGYTRRPTLREIASEDEQPEQEPQHDYRTRYDRGCYKCGSHYCPADCPEPTHLVPQQPNTIANSEAIPEQISEPVAVPQFRVQGCSDWYDGYPDYSDGTDAYETRTLYTTPPQPKWVGLTEEEQEALWDEAVDRQEHFCSQYGEFADAIEAKLKEKNA